MAKWICLNTTRISLGKGPVLIKEGDLIDDTQYNMAQLRAAGCVFEPGDDVYNAGQQASVAKQVRKGNQNPERQNQAWWGTYMRKGSVVVSGTNTTATLTFTAAEPDTNYFVTATCTALSSGANGQSAIEVAMTKNTGNVVLTVQVAPGATQSASFDICVLR